MILWVAWQEEEFFRGGPADTIKRYPPLAARECWLIMHRALRNYAVKVGWGKRPGKGEITLLKTFLTVSK